MILCKWYLRYESVQIALIVFNVVIVVLNEFCFSFGMFTIDLVSILFLRVGTGWCMMHKLRITAGEAYGFVLLFLNFIKVYILSIKFTIRT